MCFFDGLDCVFIVGIAHRWNYDPHVLVTRSRGHVTEPLQRLDEVVEDGTLRPIVAEQLVLHWAE